MTHDIDAIYHDGFFQPLAPPMIPDGTRVRLRVEEINGEREGSIESPENENARQRAELDEFRRTMSELPIQSPNDGFSGADHDRVLYGKR